MSRAIGIKLDVDAAIWPRDATLGTKILTLIPLKCKIVQDFKKYVAESVLKTPISLNLYIGDYRLRDEEDVVVFTCFPDPCRVSPANAVNISSPVRQASSSSTPVLSKQNNVQNEFSGPFPAAKRVKFNDTPLSVCAKTTPHLSPSQDVLSYPGFDQIDAGNIRGAISASSSLGARKNPGSSKQKEQSVSDQNSEFNNGMIVDESMLSANVDVEQRKKRRRRRRQKKSIVVNSDDDSFNQPGAQSTLIASADLNNTAGNNILNGNNNGTSFYGDIETETDLSTPTPTNSSFKKPEPRKSILRNSANFVQINEGSNGNISGPPTSIAAVSTPVSKKLKSRQDTPVLPRVLKNPGIFERAQQNLGSQLRALEFNSSIAEENEPQTSLTVPTVTSAPEVSGKVKANGKERDDDFYDRLSNVTDASEIKVFDRIAFKAVEMDEKYCPRVSPYREAIVILKNESSLTLNYIKKEAVERTGMFEIDDEDFVGDQIDETIKDFSSLISVKIVEAK